METISAFCTAWDISLTEALSRNEPLRLVVRVFSVARLSVAVS